MGLLRPKPPPLEAHKRNVLRHGAFEDEAPPLEAQKTERPSKRHTQSPDIDPIKKIKNRAVQGSCAHKFVQKSGSIIGRLEPKFSLSPYSLRCFGGASLIRWLDDFWCFFELVFIALPL